MNIFRCAGVRCSLHRSHSLVVSNGTARRGDPVTTVGDAQRGPQLKCTQGNTHPNLMCTRGCRLVAVEVRNKFGPEAQTATAFQRKAATHSCSSGSSDSSPVRHNLPLGGSSIAECIASAPTASIPDNLRSRSRAALNPQRPLCRPQRAAHMGFFGLLETWESSRQLRRATSCTFKTKQALGDFPTPARQT